MQPPSSASAWLDEAEDRAVSQEAVPDLADVLSELEQRPQAQPEPGQAEADDAPGAYLHEIGRGTLLTKPQAVELATQKQAGSDAAPHRQTEASPRPGGCIAT